MASYPEGTLRELNLHIVVIPASGEEPATYTIYRDTRAATTKVGAAAVGAGERPFVAVCVECILPTATEAIHTLLAQAGGETPQEAA